MDNDIKLFLIEVMVNSVTFNEAAKFEAGVKSLRVQIQFSNIVKMDTSMNIKLSENWKGEHIVCNCGKSFLFPCNYNALAQSLLQKHLEIKLRENYELIGESKIHWDNRFIETTRNVGDPVCIIETHSINKYLLKVGEMQVFVRLTCYGDGMESNMTHSGESTAQSLKSTSDFLIQKTSFVELYKGDKQLDYEDTQSVAPAEFDKHTHFNDQIMALTSKSKSICARPKEDDFLNVQRLNYSEILTNERINNLLCNSKYCPAAKKFKEFGLGPLAKTKNLGCADPNMIPPSTYALSHTYGTLDRYGPYGLFSRPKRLDLPFIPRKNALETIITDDDCTNVVKCNENQVCPRDKPKDACPLRLTGGGASFTDDFKKPKSPFDVCKDVMIKCDKIVAEYRKALGPCGQTVCPYAPNALGEFCKKTCDFTRQKKETIEKVNKNDSAPCKNKPACGSPRCAYSKYKTGLVDSDAQMELAFLPPAIVGKCGHPKCEYPFKQEELPPIHWDCPEPLPKGVCKNPNCPYLPADLKALLVLKKNKAPCGSNACPYALPPPCAAPTCPFNRNPCPGLKKKDKCDDLKQNQCNNSNCPYIRKDNAENCPAIKNKNGKCDNPDCPKEHCPKILDERDNCGDPNCPFVEKHESEVSDSLCNNPDCPYKQDPSSSSSSSSSSDDNCIRICPKAILKMIDNEICQNPKCPGYEPGKKQENDDLYRCSNPDCPAFAKQKKNKNSCDNPDCPNQQKESEKTKSKDICDNPDCPYASKESFCSNPDCPWAKPPKEDNCYMPNCPLAQSDSFCTFPNCPFNKKEDICDNPDCQFNKKKDICDNPDCPFAHKDYCNDPNCPFLRLQKPIENKNYQKELIKRGSMSQYVLNQPTKSENIETVDNQPEDAPISSKKNLKKRKRRGKYVYSMGDRYPGMKIGHAECNIPVFRVPPKMGWLWNIHTPCGRLRV